VIRVAPAPNYPPIEFFDEAGTYKGVTADFLAIIEKKLGVRFQVVRLKDWAQVLEKTKQGGVDIWGEAAKTPERAEYMLFTTPYIRFPSVILTRKEGRENLTLDSLSGLKVVAIAGYATHDYLVESHPDVELITVPDIETGLKMVSFGVADVIVASAAPASYYIEKNVLANLVMAGESGYNWELAIASRKDWPELNMILQKALDAIKPEERQAIFRKWLDLGHGASIAGKSLWFSILAGAGVGGLVILAILVWNLSLRKLATQRTRELNAELDERKRAEKALAKSEERLARFFEASYEGLFFHDQGRILDVNAATTEIFGYPSEELIGRNLLEFVAPESQEGVRRRMHSGEEGPYEIGVVKKDGSTIPVEVRAKTLEHKGKTMRVVALQDISERRRAEQALQESEERYRLLVELSPDAITVLGADYKVLFANPATAKLLGAPDPGVLIGKPFFEWVHPEDRAGAAQRIEQMTRGKTQLPPREYRFLRFDGTEIFGAVTSTPFTYDGKAAIQAIARDITEHKRAEAALQKAHHELESKVAERTRELREANEKLLELDRLKSLFIASMSHELRTPLNAIIGFTGVILQGMSGELNARQQDQLGRVYASARHLLALITEVIDISKIEAGRVDVFPETFMLEDVVAEAVSNVQDALGRKGLTLEVHVPSALRLYTDRKRLLQCILNYLSNAVKYSEHGTIIVAVRDTGDEVEVVVRDTGIGIAEDALPRLFQPFERIESPLRIKNPGTGLGLYLCKKIATEMLEGAVSVESRPEVGSTFRLRVRKNLPPKEARAARQRP